MKTYFYSRLFGIALLFFPVAAMTKSGAVDVESLLSAQTVEQLAQAVTRVEVQRRRSRGCEIQRQEKVVPTLCYAAKPVDDLDRECLRISRTATRLPRPDIFTSSICRDAIETRERDLAYAGHRDASR